MVKAADLRSGEGSVCRFDSRHGQFIFLYLFYDDDGGAACSGAGERKAQALTCRNERSECRR